MTAPDFFWCHTCQSYHEPPHCCQVDDELPRPVSDEWPVKHEFLNPGGAYKHEPDPRDSEPDDHRKYAEGFADGYLRGETDGFRAGGGGKAPELVGWNVEDATLAMGGFELWVRYRRPGWRPES